MSTKLADFLFNKFPQGVENFDQIYEVKARVFYNGSFDLPKTKNPDLINIHDEFDAIICDPHKTDEEKIDILNKLRKNGPPLLQI